MKHLLFSRDGKHKVADGSVQRLTSRGFGRERDYVWHTSFAEMQAFPQGLPFLHCLGCIADMEPVAAGAAAGGGRFVKWPLASRHCARPLTSLA